MINKLENENSRYFNFWKEVQTMDTKLNDELVQRKKLKNSFNNYLWNRSIVQMNVK